MLYATMEKFQKTPIPSIQEAFVSSWVFSSCCIFRLAVQSDSWACMARPLLIRAALATQFASLLAIGAKIHRSFSKSAGFGEYFQSSAGFHSRNCSFAPSGHRLFPRLPQSTLLQQVA